MPTVAGLGKNQDGSRNARIGLEHAGGHGNYGFQTVVLDDFLANRLVCSGRAEQNAVRDDAGTASADLQHPQEQSEEQQLGLFGLAELEQVGGNNVVVQTALEWGICQNQAVSVLVGVLVAQAVAVLDERVVHAVEHHVHSTDAQHGAVHVEAVEHVVHVVVFVFAVKKHFLLAIFF